MVKKLFASMAVLLALFCCPTVLAQENAMEENAGEELQSIYDSLSDDSLGYLNEVFPHFDFSKALTDMMQGNTGFGVTTVLNTILGFFTGELRDTLKYLAAVLIIGVLSGIVESFDAGMSKGVKNACFFGTFALAAGILVTAFMECAQIGSKLIEDLSLLFSALIPALSTFLATSGSPVAAAALNPLLLLTLQIFTGIIHGIFLPTVFTIAALSIMNSLTENRALSGLVSFLKGFVKWGVSLLLTIFTGILSVQGFLASSADSVSLRAAKFVVGGAVPMVGGILSDAVDMVTSSSMLIKNAVGGVGFVVIVGMSVIPLLKIAAPIIMFKLCGALIAPICDKRMESAVSDLAGALSMIFVCALSVMLFLLVAVTILLKSGVVRG